MEDKIFSASSWACYWNEFRLRNSFFFFSILPVKITKIVLDRK